MFFAPSAAAIVSLPGLWQAWPMVKVYRELRAWASLPEQRTPYKLGLGAWNVNKWSSSSSQSRHYLWTATANNRGGQISLQDGARKLAQQMNQLLAHFSCAS